MAQTSFSGPVASQNGFVLPSLTTAEINAIQNPQVGQMVYDTTAVAVKTYNGTAWA